LGAVPAPRSICRDCEATDGVRQGRCVACGSPRWIAHPELAELAIAHVDCDAFYAAVEKRDDPSLRDKPVIVGGSVRGVVATACYIARIHGVRSAMPMFKALKACPHAVVLPPDFDRYLAVSREVRRLMLDLTPLVEPLSIDEAFLDLSGTQAVHGAVPAMSLVRFVRSVEREIGITVSVGLAPNKFLAKIASEQAKPRGFSVIGRAEAADFLADRPIAIIPGIGRRTEERLARQGITLVRHLRERGDARLVASLGREGDRLSRLARGEDHRRVNPSRETKSVSAETTFNHDLSAIPELEPVLWRLCERVSKRLKAKGLAGTSVTLKLKNRSFQIVTRTRSGLPATQLVRRLYDPARALLHATAHGDAYRLIGVAAGDLCGADLADRGDLADTSVRRESRMEAAIDRLRERFGSDTVQTGLAFRFSADSSPSRVTGPAAPDAREGRNRRNPA
jgi:DNA polymerase-4